MSSDTRGCCLRSSLDDPTQFPVVSSTPLTSVTPSQSQYKSPSRQILHEKRKNVDGEWKIDRSYEIISRIGKGGFAKVYLARDTASSEKVAIKVIDKSTLEKDSFKEKLNQEIKFQKSLNHENVVRYFSSFEDSKNVYIVLEYCSNQTFKELLDRRKKLTEVEVKSHLLSIISSLQYIHSRGIIHRDLKIANIFLNDKMELKLADFGLSASLKSPSHRRKTVCGTPNYIAPEVLKNEGHDFLVDNWAIGVIVYTFLIGKPPFEEKEVEHTLKNIQNNRYSFPENCGISNEARDFIERILVTNPAFRMTMREMLDHPFLVNHTHQIPRTLPVSTLALPPSASYLRKLAQQQQQQHDDTQQQLCLKSLQFSSGVLGSAAAATTSSGNFFGISTSASCVQLPGRSTPIPIISSNQQVNNNNTKNQENDNYQLLRARSSEQINTGIGSSVSTEQFQNYFSYQQQLQQQQLQQYQQQQRNLPDPNQYLVQKKQQQDPKAQQGIKQTGITTQSLAQNQNVPARFPSAERVSRLGNAQLAFSSVGANPSSQHVYGIAEIQTSPSARSSPPTTTATTTTTAITATSACCMPSLTKTSSKQQIETLCQQSPPSLPTSHQQYQTSNNQATTMTVIASPTTPTTQQIFTQEIPTSLVSVREFIDCSEKFGLAYLLTNGKVGVSLNDGNIISLNDSQEESTRTEIFSHISKSNYAGMSHRIETYAINQVPTQYQSLLLLVKSIKDHFTKKYQSFEQSEQSPSLKQQQQQQFSLRQTHSEKDDVYVKKFILTRQASFFRFSNKDLQVIFSDKSEVAITQQDRLLIYKEQRKGITRTYSLKQPFKVELPIEIRKRVNYIKSTFLAGPALATTTSSLTTIAPSITKATTSSSMQIQQQQSHPHHYPNPLPQQQHSITPTTSATISSQQKLTKYQSSSNIAYPASTPTHRFHSPQSLERVNISKLNPSDTVAAIAIHQSNKNLINYTNMYSENDYTHEQNVHSSQPAQGQQPQQQKHVPVLKNITGIASNRISANSYFNQNHLLQSNYQSPPPHGATLSSQPLISAQSKTCVASSSTPSTLIVESSSTPNLQFGSARSNNCQTLTQTLKQTQALLQQSQKLRASAENQQCNSPQMIRNPYSQQSSLSNHPYAKNSKVNS